MVNSFEISGARKGKLELLRKQLMKKFGELPPAALERLAIQPVERLEEIALALFEAESLKELGLADE